MSMMAATFYCSDRGRLPCVVLAADLPAEAAAGALAGAAEGAPVAGTLAEAAAEAQTEEAAHSRPAHRAKAGNVIGFSPNCAATILLTISNTSVGEGLHLVIRARVLRKTSLRNITAISKPSGPSC